MTIQVDLSELHPNAAERLVRAHVNKPLSQDVLFKVSKKAFASCLKRRPKSAVGVSAQEVKELNSFLGKSRSTKDYAIWKRIPCSNCGKVLTFYDIFQSGRKRHGEDYIRRFLGGDEHH